VCALLSARAVGDSSRAGSDGPCGAVCVQVYRFACRLVDPIPEDAMRRFTIQFYPADDNVAVYEPAIRNSGIMGGKFLARGKHKKTDGCQCGCAVLCRAAMSCALRAALRCAVLRSAVCVALRSALRLVAL
jgi:hypothetical protein